MPGRRLGPRAPIWGPSPFRRVVGHAPAHRATWANVGAHGRTWAVPRSEPGIIRETRPRAHSRAARSGRKPLSLWPTPPPSVDAPFVELHERHNTAQLPMSNGARPVAGGTTWSTVRSLAGARGADNQDTSPVLATPGAEHAGTQSLPGPRAVQGVVPAAVGLAGVLGTAATRAAGDDTTDRAQLHPRIRRGGRWRGLFAWGASPGEPWASRHRPGAVPGN
jgi:hypothetical protein